MAYEAGSRVTIKIECDEPYEIRGKSGVISSNVFACVWVQLDNPVNGRQLYKVKRHNLVGSIPPAPRKSAPLGRPVDGRVSHRMK